MKNDLDETTAGLLEDKKFAQNLEKTCADKAKEFDERTKTRAEELVALADTIKILNDDDALELFKKTLPSASFVQMRASNLELRKNAVKHLRARNSDPRVGAVLMALHAGSISFAKI